MEGVLEILLAKQLNDHMEFGAGDACADCSNTFVGWGLCKRCGAKLDHPEECHHCKHKALGVCGKCVDRRSAACRCDSVWKESAVLIFKQGWHHQDNTAVELCPTYWPDMVNAEIVRIEQNCIRGGKRLAPGSYRRRTTYRVDPLDKQRLIVSPEYNKITREEKDLG